MFVTSESALESAEIATHDCCWSKVIAEDFSLILARPDAEVVITQDEGSKLEESLLFSVITAEYQSGHSLGVRFTAELTASV